MTTLPVVEPGATTTSPVTVPYFADGGGWSSQVVMTNPVNDTLVGLVQFVGTEGQTLRTQPFSIAPRSSARIQTDGTAEKLQTGSVRISISTGPTVPAVTSIFTYRANGVTVTEAGVGTVSDSPSFELYAELSGTTRTGFAVANPSASLLTLTIAVGGQTASVSVPGSGQRAFFLNEIPELASLPLPFQGVMSVSAAVPFVVTGIRGRTNERGDFLITTTPAVNSSLRLSSAEFLFPHFADGAGYSTQFVLFAPSAAGTMYFFEQSGEPKALVFP
jgi:hypothetical protein